MIQPLTLTILLCFVCALSTGCGQNRGAQGSSFSRVTSVSRVVMPANGGLTIRPPQKMADVTTLWSPLSRHEKRLVAQSKIVPVQLDDSHIVLKNWLPSNERLTMQGYYQRLMSSNAQAMTRTLARANTYLPEIKAILRSKGIPEALAYLPMVESAYEPEAISHAGAVGLWQLMPATATRFGLTVNNAVDERLDPLKSTHAAAAYLRWLYEYFNDWPLAVTAYNCGEGAMQRALKGTSTVSLTDLSLVCRQSPPASGGLTRESLDFLPQLVAAANFFTARQQGIHEPLPQRKTTATIPPPAQGQLSKTKLASTASAGDVSRPTTADLSVPLIKTMKRLSP